MQMSPVWERSPAVGMQCEAEGGSPGQGGNAAVDPSANRVALLMGRDAPKLHDSIKRLF